MKTRLLILGACAAMVTPALAMTTAECKTEWTKADANKDGVLTGAEAERYLAAMRVGNKSLAADAKLDDAMFMKQCEAGMFTAAKMEVGAPLAGANSFTENQAKDRAVAAGFTDVTALVKDADGIWRGTAKSGDKSVKIAVDFKGNVVAN